MASQQKQEKYLFLTTETWQNNKNIFYFSWNEVTTNPRHYSRSIWHHRKNKKKNLFLTTETWKKQEYFLIFLGGTR